MVINKWDERFLELAQLISTWSKDPSTQVGSCIVDPETKRVVSMGYNGFARGLSDSLERYEDKELKHSMVLHAEENAIMSSVESLRGYTAYVYPLKPCSNCAARLIQSGISRVVVLADVEKLKGRDFSLSKDMFQEAGVEYEVHYVLDKGNAEGKRNEGNNLSRPEVCFGP